MFSRVNERGEILHPDLVTPDVDLVDTPESATSHAIIRMREPPSVEAWEDVRTVFSSLLSQVESMTREMAELKRQRARDDAASEGYSARDGDGRVAVSVHSGHTPLISPSGSEGGGGGGGGHVGGARRESVQVAASMLSNPIFTRPRRLFEPAMATTAVDTPSQKPTGPAPPPSDRDVQLPSQPARSGHK